ncbi:MAG: hypothetical protein FJ387_04565 [Verrucomicrobia bacterium]|nr:hypothetical protein [Verrucomicrobiota bacterium]
MNIKEVLGEVAGKLRSKIGLEPSDLQRMQKATDEANQRLTEAEDRLSALRDEATRAETRILHRKREHDGKKGIAKTMLGREIERMVGRLQPLLREHEIQLNNMDATHALLSKMRELAALLAGSVQEEQIDAVAVQLEEAIDAAERADQAMESLKALRVRTAQAEAELAAAPAPATAGAEKAEGFSDNTAAFLKQLEADQA